MPCFIIGYGLTEMATVMITPPDGMGKPGSVGVPMPNLQVKVSTYQR